MVKYATFLNGNKKIIMKVQSETDITVTLVDGTVIQKTELINIEKRKK